MLFGYTAGVFDCFHYGHVELLTRASKLCDYLIVGISTDELCQYKNVVPLIPQYQRKKIVESIQGVSAVVLQDNIDKFYMWTKLKFNILFVGDDWYCTDSWKLYDEKFKSVNVKVVYLSRTPNISSTQIRSIKKPVFIFDLDKTLWPSETNLLKSDDLNIEKFIIFQESFEIVRYCKSMGYHICIASRSKQICFCESILNQYNINFDCQAIFHTHIGKTPHLLYIKQCLNVNFCQMILFDDDDININNANEIGVTTVKVNPEIGITWKDLSFGLLRFIN